MAKLHHEWKVLPHGPVETVDERIVTVEGEIPMPLGKFPRRMTVVGLSRNRSAVFSAIPLDEAGMKRIEEVGRPAFLIVPNAHHRLDAPAWKKRYPRLKVVCPPGAKKAVTEAVPVDSTEDILRDGETDFVIVEGTGAAEAALVVRRKGGATLIVNDVVANVRHPHGLGAKIMARLFGFGVHRPQVPRVVKRAMVEDEKQLAAQLISWSKIPGLQRLIPSHGEIIDGPGPALRRIGRSMA
ncbi:MAG TPA: hypothetical protein VH392_08165 [Sphingomicrobium sp.]